MQEWSAPFVIGQGRLGRFSEELRLLHGRGEGLYFQIDAGDLPAAFLLAAARALA